MSFGLKSGIQICGTCKSPKWCDIPEKDRPKVDRTKYPINCPECKSPCRWRIDTTPIFCDIVLKKKLRIGFK